MKQFLLKILLFLGLFLMILLIMVSFHRYVIGNQYEQGYNASAVDKINRLCSLDSPKIILAGNSNLSFGIQSCLLEDAFHMPVVNLGLHGGLGNAFHENMAKCNIQDGDIVIVCHTTYADDDTINDPTLAWKTVEFYQNFSGLIRRQDYWNLAKAYPSYFRKAALLWLTRSGNQAKDSSYARSSFNEYGDIVYRPEKEQAAFQELYDLQDAIIPPSIRETCISRMNRLYAEITDRGAYMLAAGYPIAAGDKTAPASDFDAFQAELERSLDCPVISHFTDYFMEYRFFYNSLLHLTEEGARIRTEQLISDLSAWMEDSGYAVPAG